MDGSGTVINSYVEALIATVKEQGVDEQTLFSLLPIKQKQFTHAGARLDMSMMTLLWKRAVELTGDEYLGLHVGQQIPLGAFNLMGGLVLNSENVKVALDQVMRYQALVSEGGSLTLLQDSKLCFLQYFPAANKIPMTHYQIEGVISGLVKFSRGILPQGLAPLCVEFAHPKPTDTSAYEDFFGCPVKFDSLRHGLLFDAKLLTLTIPHSDSELLAHHRSLADKKLSRINNLQGLVARVRQVIENEGNWFELSPQKVAIQLNLSLRQMQRTLNVESSSYKEILDSARKEKAGLLLEQNILHTSDVAERLGYHNLSSFHRAFKRWYGKTPADYCSSN